MCGLVGVISVGNLSHTEQKVFSELHHVDMLRGEDSFGVINVHHSKSCEYFKLANDSPLTYAGKEYLKFMDTTVTARLGHNRSATRGSVNTANAHPFLHKHIMLMHNGTLRENIGQFTVDSDWLTHKLSESVGTEAATLSELDGAYALLWYDTKRKQVRMARNSERTLFYCKASHCTTYYVASEEGMLSWILKRNKVAHDAIKPVPTNTIFSFPSIGGSTTLEEEAIPLKKYTSYVGTGAGGWRDTTTTKTSYDSKRQNVTVTIEDWWPIHRPARFNNVGNPETFGVKCFITGLIAPNAMRKEVEIGSTVIALNVTKEALDYLVESEYGLAKVELGTGTGVTYWIAPETRGAVTFNALHYTFPTAAVVDSTVDIAKAVAVKGFYGAGSTLKPVDLDDWANVIDTTKEVAEVIKEVTPPEASKSAQLTLVHDKPVTKLASKVLLAVCGGCDRPREGSSAFYIRNGQAVCADCHLESDSVFGNLL